MELEVRVRHGATGDAAQLRRHVTELVHRSLRRLGRRLSWVVVHLDDVNGPKGGADKRCLVRIQSDAGALAVAEVRDADAIAAADQGIRRALRGLKTTMLRQRRDSGARRSGIPSTRGRGGGVPV